MATPSGEYFHHQTVRIVKNGQTTFTVIEKDETTNGLLIQRTNSGTPAAKCNGEVFTRADLMKYKEAPFWSRFRMCLLLLLWVAIFGLTGGAVYLVASSGRACAEENWATGWWRNSLMYQINVRTFQDSDSDGIGDLAGVRSRLDYLQSIKVETIVLNPIFMGVHGNSFAVTDFSNIDPQIGTLQDFNELVADVHARNMTIVIDFVVTHTAREHAWFPPSEMATPAFSADVIQTRDFYVWHDGVWDTSELDYQGRTIPGPPNSWKTRDDGRSTAWTWSGTRKQYHLHHLSNALPTLNYASETLKNVMDDVLRFWLRRGVDGFRVLTVKDIFPGPSKYIANLSDPALPVETTALLKRWRGIMDTPSSGGRSGIHKVLIVDGEGVSISQLGIFGVDLVVNANLMKWNSTVKNPGQHIAALIDSALKTATHRNPVSWAVGNYDEHRAASRVGSLELVDAVNIIYMLLPGTVMAFYGDELGLKDAAQSSPRDRNYPADGPQITPMLWTLDALAGFTNSSNGPWISIPKPHQRSDVQSQLQTRRSHLKVFQQLAELRKTSAMRNAAYRAGVVGETVFSFVRQLKWGSGYLILVDLRKNGLLESHPREYSLSSAQLKGTGVLALGSVSLYNTKNGGPNPLAKQNATVDLSGSIVLRESEAVVIRFPA
ncbi:Maltase A2 [Hypsibius exemplaris]|uniref:alpha-glucosidase n=1 Tax=Hypsibius exemplaris TaxID=2072580 RepID=A0A9X6NMA8_HYPEX|nr:Maltase A2 [Hypsibius exemplaris]